MGEERAEYGKKIIDTLAASLTQDFGNSYNARNLRAFRSFYLKFKDFEIWNARVPNLQWTHVVATQAAMLMAIGKTILIPTR